MPSLTPTTIAIAVLSLINIVAFLIMLWDKIRSRKSNTRRISEGTLFFMATLFGSIGVFVGMFAFRHKTSKWYFLIGIPLLMAQNAAFLYQIYLFYLKYY
jgi:uncharacterized membrane protein YsdA (DUF1294 family)